MMLKNIAVRTQVTRGNQLFNVIISLERNSGGIQYCSVELEKGFKAADTADKLEDLARQVREA